MTETFSDRWAVPAALTLCIYAALATGLWGVNEYLGDEDERAVVEMEFFEPPRPKPKPKPEKLVEPEPEPEPPEPEVAPKQPPKQIAKATREPVRDRPPAAPPPPDLPEPAPGEPINDDDLAPKRVYRLPDQGPGGTIPVARGRSTGKTGGVEGGTGTNTGGGGEPDSKGTAVRKPVSITALKKKPMPKGGQDFSKLKQPIEKEVVIKVRVLVDEAGAVAKATLVQRADETDLNEIALELARKLLFEPALDQDDRPVATQIVWTFRFTPG